MREVAAALVRTFGAPMLLVLGTTMASAQQPPAPSSRADADPAAQQPVSPGPLTIERIPSGWVIAPDVTITDFNKRTGTILGGYGGWLQDQTWFVGAAGYWLVDGQGHDSLGYGGLVFQFLWHADRPIGFAVRGLVGGGYGDISATYQQVYGGTPPPTAGFPDVAFGHGHHPDNHPPTPITPNTVLVFHEDFFVSEPQAQVTWNVTPGVRLTFGAGYRFTAGSEVDDRLSGPLGSVSVAFGGGH
jgi:hypothetical protein